MRGYIVVPYMERQLATTQHQPQPPLPVSQRLPYQTFGPGYNAYVLANYESLRFAGPVVRQIPHVSPFFAGLHSHIATHAGGGSCWRWLMGFSDASTQTRARVLRGKVRDQLNNILVHPVSVSVRREQYVQHYAPYWAMSVGRVAPGLDTARHTDISNVDVGVVMLARIGSYVLGSAVDLMYPTENPFCPCCRKEESETWAHHLLGHCLCTQEESEAKLQCLLRCMTIEAPQWVAQFQNLAATVESKAALILCAADYPMLREAVRGSIAHFLAKWIQDIIKDHPLCARQCDRFGGSLALLRYQGVAYDTRPWLPAHDEMLLRAQTVEAAYHLFPGKARRAVRIRFLLLHAQRSVDV